MSGQKSKLIIYFTFIKNEQVIPSLVSVLLKFSKIVITDVHIVLEMVLKNANVLVVMR